jgi:hypothetical protein
VNLGGEPERDDSGLPPVDIEVPDDARELDRDVQAYRRELRALRRRQRRMRLHAPLTRDGVVLPLLASCLVLALIAGTLLTVFTAGPGGGLPGRTTRPTTSARASSRPATSPPAGPADSPIATSARTLPDIAIRFGARQTPLRRLTPAVVALVPAGCGCATAIGQLVRQAKAARIRFVLVSAKGRVAAARQLVAKALGPVHVAEDFTGALYSDYPPRGLTAVLAGRDDSVTEATSLSPNFRLTNQLNALQAARAAPSPPAAPTTPAATASSS